MKDAGGEKGAHHGSEPPPEDAAVDRARPSVASARVASASDVGILTPVPAFSATTIAAVIVCGVAAFDGP